MVSFLVVFYMFVVLFAIIGMIRGWAQELLVTFSVILGLFMINILEGVVFKRFASGVFADGTVQQFWLRLIIVVILVFFGYQTPRISRFSAQVKKDKISDSFLGFFLGAINGYLVSGTLWFFMAHARYPFKHFIDPSLLLNLNQLDLNESMQATINFVAKLPPAWLGSEPGIYIAVGLAFLFVLVVFI